MAAWFSKMIGALGAGEAGSSPRRILLDALRDRIKISLEPIKPGNEKAALLMTTIEQVRDDDLVISQPAIGGLTHPLAFGEDLRISFFNRSVHHSGMTRCLGRVKIPTGGHHTLFAYRLEMPHILKSEDRRGEPRIDLPVNLDCEAQIYTPSCDGPILGRVVDISMSGAQIQTAMAASKILPGQDVYLKSMLPEPVGLLDELVRIVRVEPTQPAQPTESAAISSGTDDHDGGVTIGLSFKRRIHGLAELIRAEQARHVPPAVARRMAG